MNKINSFFQGDKAIWIIFFFLCMISLIEVFSAASTLTYKSGSYWGPLIRHGAFLAVGTLVVVGVHNIPCRWFKIVPVLTLPFAWIFMFTLLMGWGTEINDGARWSQFLGIPFQPSEIAKGALITATALILAVTQTEKGADKQAFKLILGLSVFTCGMIFPENLSTAVLLFGVIILMMFIGRVPLLQIGKLLGLLTLFGVIAVSALLSIPESSEESLNDLPVLGRTITWKHRLEKHMHHNKQTLTPTEFDIDRDGQIAHANIAIATSNVIGKMPGNSVERDFLSQAFSDFIYAIIIEEMGLLGGGFVLFLYIVLLIRAGRIASRCERNFPAFLVMGLALQLVVQALVNMMVAVGLFPVTGQPLPLISRGGTSTIINCVYIGMILSVSRYAKKKQAQREGIRSLPEAPDVTNEYYNEKGMV